MTKVETLVIEKSLEICTAYKWMKELMTPSVLLNIN
jgi:hypothetical protein